MKTNTQRRNKATRTITIIIITTVTVINIGRKILMEELYGQMRG
jgi:hypothetical protein